MESKSAFAAACLAATLVTAWAPTPAEAVVAAGSYLNLQTNLTLALKSCSVMWGAGTLILVGGGSLKTGISGFNQLTSIGSLDIQRWAMVAVPDDGTTGHVVVSMSDPSIGAGHEFSELFPGVDEAALSQQVLAGNTSVISDFLTTAENRGSGVGSRPAGGVIFKYSSGVEIGSLNFSVTPEPATLTAAISAAIAVGRRRRR